MVRFWENPVFASASILCVLLYSKILPVKDRNPFSSPVAKEEIVRLSGKVASNPVKSSFFGGTYKITLSVFEAKSENASGNASGNAVVFIPSKIVESLYPGKLYTSAKNSDFPLIENGILVSCDVKYQNKKNIKNAFLATDVKEDKNVKKTLSSGKKKAGSKQKENTVRLCFLNASGNGVLNESEESGKEMFRCAQYNENKLAKLKSRVIKFRSLCRLQFKRLMYAWGNAGGLLLALVSGSREYTETEVGTAFKNAGLSHILALSGMHLSLFGGIALFFGKKISTRKIAAGIQLCAVIFFVWFAGISPSLFRAFLSALIIFSASLLKISAPEGLSILSLTFLIHIMIFPEHIFDAGFMLSYSSLAGIILFSKPIKKIIHPLVPYKIRSSLGDSASAQITTAPVALSLFGKIMPVGIFASVVVSPLVVLFLYFGLFGIVLCLFLPFLSGPFSDIMNKIYYIIKLLVLFFSRFS